jgi:hypothetical protein
MSPAPAPQTCLSPGKTASTPQWSLTKRDIAILQDLSSLRVATAKDIALLHFTPHSLTYGRERASYLAGNADQKAGEYLYRFVPPRRAKGNPERVYALGSKGAQALAAITGMPVPWYYHLSKLKSVSFQFLRHGLLLTRIIAALTYFVRTHPQYSLTRCRLFYELSRMQLPATSEVTEKPHFLPVIPDAWVHVERSDGQGTPLWIEADCGTETRGKFHAYLKARIAFLQRGDYARVFGTTAVLMCFLTTGHIEAFKDTRRQALQEWTQEVLVECGLQDWAANFRFVAVGYDELFTIPLCDSAIWYFPDSRTPVSFFTEYPMKPHEEQEHGPNATPHDGHGNDCDTPPPSPAPS